MLYNHLLAANPTYPCIVEKGSPCSPSNCAMLPSPVGPIKLLRVSVPLILSFAYRGRCILYDSEALIPASILFATSTLISSFNIHFFTFVYLMIFFSHSLFQRGKEECFLLTSTS